MAFNLYGRAAAFGEDEEIEEETEQLSIPNHAFDLIIADECHGVILPKKRISGETF